MRYLLSASRLANDTWPPANHLQIKQDSVERDAAECCRARSRLSDHAAGWPGKGVIMETDDILFVFERAFPKRIWIEYRERADIEARQYNSFVMLGHFGSV